MVRDGLRPLPLPRSQPTLCPDCPLCGPARSVTLSVKTRPLRVRFLQPPQACSWERAASVRRGCGPAPARLRRSAQQESQRGSKAPDPRPIANLTEIRVRSLIRSVKPIRRRPSFASIRPWLIPGWLILRISLVRWDPERQGSNQSSSSRGRPSRKPLRSVLMARPRRKRRR